MPGLRVAKPAGSFSFLFRDDDGAGDVDNGIGEGERVDEAILRTKE